MVPLWSLGWEDLLEEAMATLSSILAWKILWTEEPDVLQSMGSWRVGHSWVTNTHLLKKERGGVRSRMTSFQMMKAHQKHVFTQCIKTITFFWTWHCYIYFFQFIYFWLLWLFVAACELSLDAGSGGHYPVVMHGLLILVTSVVVEHRFQAHGLQ